MDWLLLPFVPEPKEVYEISCVPDHVYVSGPLGFADGLLGLANKVKVAELSELCESSFPPRSDLQLFTHFELVELEIPPGFWVTIPVTRAKIFHHRWLGWYNKKTGEIPFEIHIREFRSEDFGSHRRFLQGSGLLNSPPPFSTLQHYGWAVSSVEELVRIEENEQRAGKHIVRQAIDRRDGVKRIYVVQQFDDPGKIGINEYLWKPPGFQQKVLGKQVTS